MSSAYDYRQERKELFTDKGQRIFLKFRDRCDDLLRISGAFTLDKAICEGSFGGGTSYTHIACVDRMVELGELIELGRCGSWAQDRVFARPARR